MSFALRKMENIKLGSVDAPDAPTDILGEIITVHPQGHAKHNRVLRVWHRDGEDLRVSRMVTGAMISFEEGDQHCRLWHHLHVLETLRLG